ncbi:MAG: DUF1553 domain-containing protein [Planctomycetes bacterium]|nr:DUF1553 domain-containing protein [Planctomycetota bacterium]
MRPTIAVLAIFFALLPSSVIQAEDVTSDELPLHRLIDEHIEARFPSWNAVPASLCSDAEFVRRVYLDLTGTIPSARVAYSFIASEHLEKRTTLVDELQSTEQYARRMATYFDVALMERRPDKYVTSKDWRSYLADSFMSNKPFNQIAAEILGADGVDESLRPAAKFYLDRDVDKDTLVRDIGRLFLGVDLQCAQCHDHPDIDDYLHQHYHGLSVFVAGSKTFKQPDGTMVLQEMITREVEFTSVFSPDTTQKTGPRLIDALLEVPEFTAGEEYLETPSRTVRAIPKFSLRELLADKVSHESPEFSRNVVNRLWAMMMGRGLVHPLDMHHSSNPPSHPDLLDRLSKRFAESQFDTKKFIRLLTLSDAYQRSSLIPEGVAPANVPPESFAVANMKGLSPEQLFDSLLTATDADRILAQQIDEALTEQTLDAAEPEESDKLITVREELRAAHVAEFVSLFGTPPGQSESEFSASLPQALFFANSETISAWLPPRLGNLSERLVSLVEPDAVAHELYLSVLSRLPVEEELAIVREQLQAAPAEQRRTAITELVWSLLASAEFRLNH